MEKTKKSGKRQAASKKQQGQEPEIPKRLNHPSPLSKPMTMNANGPPTTTQTPSKTTPATTNHSKAASPAAQRLTDITKKDQTKTGNSRMRRAFSFGSAAELRRVSV